MFLTFKQLLNHFLTTGEDENYLEAEVLGKRKREIGLILPAKYKATTKDIRFAKILREKLEEKKKILNIDIVEDVEFKKFPDKKTKKNKICQRKSFFFSKVFSSLPSRY